MAIQCTNKPTQSISCRELKWQRNDKKGRNASFHRYSCGLRLVLAPRVPHLCEGLHLAAVSLPLADHLVVNGVAGQDQLGVGAVVVLGVSVVVVLVKLHLQDGLQ